MPAAAIILAGGDGTRLRSLTRRLTGDDRPKQFCALLGGETLLEQTRRRAARLIAPGRTLLAVTRTHEPYYRPALADLPSCNIVAQPANRGTAPAILYALLRLRAVAPADAVVLLAERPLRLRRRRPHGPRGRGAGRRPRSARARRPPRDRAGPARGRVRLDRARRADPGPVGVAAPPRAPLLGKTTDRGRPAAHAPPQPVEQLRDRGQSPPARAAHRRDPAGAGGRLRAAARARGHRREDEAARVVYGRLATTDFSRGVLQPRADDLAVLPVTGIGWSDLGEPMRVVTTQRRLLSARATA